MDKTGSVVVSGGFDPLHVGHVKMFQEATKLAARLIVIVNNDNFLMQKKGYAFMPIDERIEIIKNIPAPNFITISIPFYNSFTFPCPWIRNGTIPSRYVIFK